MGSVWIAEDIDLGVRVAVKFILPDIVRRDPTLLQRFKRAASAAARIHSPHVVAIKRYGLMDDDAPYIVMELLRGESLAEHLERVGAIAPSKVARLLDQLADVLGSAHAEGIVHRDIKPENIFLSESTYELFVKVLDFGVARIGQSARGEVTTLTEQGALIGTPEFMSPEQIDGAAADHRVDLWAVGVVAYRALTGRLPFTGRSLPRVSMAVSEAKFAPATELRPELPAAIDGWFSRALARDPAARFESARELSDAFASIVAGPGRGSDRGSLRPDPADLAPYADTISSNAMRGAQAQAIAPSIAGSSASLGSAIVPSRRRMHLLAAIGVVATGIVGAVVMLARTRPEPAPSAATAPARLPASVPSAAATGEGSLPTGSSAARASATHSSATRSSAAESSATRSSAASSLPGPTGQGGAASTSTTAGPSGGGGGPLEPCIAEVAAGSDHTCARKTDGCSRLGITRAVQTRRAGRRG